jgi:hypothetical protein
VKYPTVDAFRLVARDGRSGTRGYQTAEGPRGEVAAVRRVAVLGVPHDEVFTEVVDGADHNAPIPVGDRGAAVYTSCGVTPSR